MVAQQALPVFVVDQRHAAVGALDHLAAVGTHGHRVVAAAVEEQNTLFPTAQVVGQFPGQACADFPWISGSHLRPHIRKFHRGQRAAAVAFPQGDQPHPPGFGGVGSLDAGGGGGKHQQGVFCRRPLFGYLVGGVTGRGFALVGMFLFLVQDDEADVFQRSKHRAAGAHHDIGVALLDHPPLQQALGVVQSAVLHGQTAAEHGFQAADHLGCEADLRHQYQRPTALGQGALNQFEKHRRFAAAGDAIQKRGPGLAGIQVRGQPVKSGLLFGGKLHRLGIKWDIRKQVQGFEPFLRLQHAFFAQGIQGGTPHAFLLQLAAGHGTVFQQVGIQLVKMDGGVVHRHLCDCWQTRPPLPRLRVDQSSCIRRCRMMS